MLLPLSWDALKFQKVVNLKMDYNMIKIIASYVLQKKKSVELTGFSLSLCLSVCLLVYLFFYLSPLSWKWPDSSLNPGFPPLFLPPTMVENRKKNRQNSHPIFHFPTSEGVSEVSERVDEWAQRRARAKRAVRSKRTSERCERTSD